MVDKEIVLETVRKMYASGIEDSVVIQTLKDIGLKQPEISKVIAEAKGISEVPSTPIASPEPKPLEQRMAAAGEKIDQAAMHTTTHNALELQTAKTAELLEKVSSLEKQLASAPKGGAMPTVLVSVNQRIGTMEKQLREIKAEIGATKMIMEKVLETDRKVLTKL